MQPPMSSSTPKPSASPASSTSVASAPATATSTSHSCTRASPATSTPSTAARPRPAASSTRTAATRTTPGSRCTSRSTTPPRPPGTGVRWSRGAAGMTEISELQGRLGAAWSMNRPGGSPHVLVLLPSFSLGESLLSHYASRIPALEHRYLLATLMLPRFESCELVFICSEAPSSEVLDYYLELASASRRTDCRERLRILAVDDLSHRSVAEKLLDRPDLVRRLRAMIGGRPAFIEPWNVTDHEVAIATRLDVPINGTMPALWQLGFKSAGRQLFREAGVPIPAGREGVRSVDDFCAAVAAIRVERPDALGVVVKHDDSGAGDGNLVVELCDVTGRQLTDAEIRSQLEAAPGWYRAD